MPQPTRSQHYPLPTIHGAKLFTDVRHGFWHSMKGLLCSQPSTPSRSSVGILPEQNWYWRASQREVLWCPLHNFTYHETQNERDICNHLFLFLTPSTAYMNSPRLQGKQFKNAHWYTFTVFCGHQKRAWKSIVNGPRKCINRQSKAGWVVHYTAFPLCIWNSVVNKAGEDMHYTVRTGMTIL